MPERGPTARASSPPPPGVHDLRGRPGAPITVVADTNALVRLEFRLPLAASAEAGDLVVAWSAAIETELTRVAYRGAMQALQRRADLIEPEARWPTLRDTLLALDEGLDAMVEALDERFRAVPPAPSVEEGALAALTDPDDRILIRTALAAGAPYLLSLDQRHLRHGTTYLGVQCWHPDTFLTLFYRQNPDAYRRAVRTIRRLPDALRRRLLP